MPPSHRRGHGPKPDRRRALELLAGSRDGYTEALMLAHFTVELMVDLCIADLAIARVERWRTHGGGCSPDDHRRGAAGAGGGIAITPIFAIDTRGTARLTICIGPWALKVARNATGRRYGYAAAREAALRE